MKNILYASALLLAVALLVAGCQRAADRPQAKQYDIKGSVVAVDKDGKSITLDHEDIPGLMQAMEMEFKIEDPQLLEGVSAGDQVHGRLEVRSGDYIITSLTKH